MTTSKKALREGIDIAKRGLAALAKLGNGDRPGNSHGNIIAQETLAAIDAALSDSPPGSDAEAKRGRCCFGADPACSPKAGECENNPFTRFPTVCPDCGTTLIPLLDTGRDICPKCNRNSES